jgi:hypothetical protein
MPPFWVEDALFLVSSVALSPPMVQMLPAQAVVLEDLATIAATTKRSAAAAPIETADAV